jgi:hypothetical protein
MAKLVFALLLVAIASSAVQAVPLSRKLLTDHPEVGVALHHPRITGGGACQGRGSPRSQTRSKVIATSNWVSMLLHPRRPCRSDALPGASFLAATTQHWRHPSSRNCTSRRQTEHQPRSHSLFQPQARWKMCSARRWRTLERCSLHYMASMQSVWPD